ncbi:Tetratricopeptide repeat protein 9C [Leucoagaricus sp. SymC.cos]|nr:Tetratricopeptide repeat protein 9C [Leucoagaricus sp. SymC.cos]
MESLASMDSIRTSTEAKLNTGKQKKDAGDQAFKKGDTQGALKSYYEALMYLLGIDKTGLQSLGLFQPPTSASDATKDPKLKEKTEVDEIIEKIYANMSACHIKNQNWKRAVETADKALQKNENNYKAMFRKAKGLGEQGFFEKASKILEDLKTKSPADAAAATVELAHLKAIDDKRERAHKQKMKGFLNRKKDDQE